MAQPPRPPEPKPAFLRFSAKDVQLLLSSPAAVLVLLVLAAAPGLVSVLKPEPKPLVQGPAPLPTPQVPLQESTTDIPKQMSAAVLRATIPDKPGPNQKRAGSCNARAAQVEINGGCWVKTETPPPCPVGYQWEHEGRCWLPVAEAKPVPTSGEWRQAGVADP